MSKSSSLLRDAAFSLGLSIVAGTSLFIYSKAKVSLTPGKRVSIKPKVQAGEWISEVAYLQLAAIVDTLLPSLSVREASDEAILSALATLGLDKTIDNMPLDLKQLVKYRNFLCAGALDYGTHRHIVDTFTRVLSNDEKTKVNGILQLLGSSTGGVILTGYAAPFSDLPLSLREKVLFSWRDSRFETFRSLFQLFKRVVSVHYMGCLNEVNGNKVDNPAWESMGYRADASRQGVTITSEDDETDRILRAQVKNPPNCIRNVVAG